MNDTGKIIFALVAGAAIGAGLGLLLAPEKGQETRRKIADTASDLTDRIMRKAEEIVSSSKDEVSSSSKFKQHS